MKKILTSLQLIRITFIGILIVTSCNVTVKYDKEKYSINKKCDKMMQLFSERKTSESIEVLKTITEVIPSNICDSLKIEVKNQFDNLTPSYGKIIGWEFAKEYSYEDYIVKRIYILKFEKYYLKFDFTIYKGSNGWKVTEFNYSNDLFDLIY
ncbi:hypothetical protein [Carboxylicivirga caseinilyticus]|uniref:hypothetical protein n=1 Tax=Carboxylicivirga caseinilyticus TaxID=3417572 RepID=UPI003D350D42|nr:hypothetical protein [Marinilabiliaceae bacterium A049]